MAQQNYTTALSSGHPLNGERVLRIPQSVLKIGTWNVQSMFQAGKTNNVINEMKRHQISILGCSEVRWRGNGQCTVDDHTIFYAGVDSNQHPNGVAVIINKEVATKVSGHLPISDRVILVQINATPFKLNVIQAYAPTSLSSEEDLETFYSDLKKAMQHTLSNEMTIILGDFNAKLGSGADGKLIGKFGLGTRNERGELLAQFCKQHEFSVMNTFFDLPPRRLYTWKAPGDSPRNIIRNQIDYILINKRFQNAITSVKTYPGADIRSDHNLLLANLRIRLKKLRKREFAPRMKTEKLQVEHVKDTIKKELNEKLSVIQTMDDGIENNWEGIKKVLLDINKNELLNDSRIKKHKWMTDEILDMIEERRKFKNKDVTRYKQIHKEIRRKVKEAKETWLNEKCNEIEDLERKHDSLNMHKKIKEAAGLYKNKSSNVILDENDKAIFDEEEKLKKWSQYIEQLFNGDRHNLENLSEEFGPEINRLEVETALKRLKNHKAPGVDEVQGDVLKLIEGDNVNLIVKLFNNIYNTAEFPEEWLLSTFVPIPKKPTAKRCQEYRTIALMSHMLKVFLKIIHSRIFLKLEDNISSTQFGFRNGFGTREALLCLNVLVQKARDLKKNVYLCFIDFEKAFDRVSHVKLLETLKETTLDDKDIRIIGNLYWQQKGNVRIEGKTSDAVEIRQGVRQGCILSPVLFNTYSESLFKEALDGAAEEEGIQIGDQHVTNVRYADDTVLIANTPQQLQNLIERVTRSSENYNMKLNTSKTKIMIVKKTPGTCRFVFNVEGAPLEQVSSYKYLGTYINQDWGHTHEIKIRIEMARTSFNRMRSVLCNMHLNINTRIRILKCYVFSVLLYGVEVWTLTKETLNRLESFEMWCYRRMLRISWIYHVTNETVLERMRKTTEIITTVKRRKLAYFGHIIRNNKYKILQDIIKCNLSGTRARGRPRTSWLDNITNWTELTSEELFIRALDKESWAVIIANV
ncbi:hypothetical protein WDU94_005636 [Cyamophila willieti]